MGSIYTGLFRYPVFFPAIVMQSYIGATGTCAFPMQPDRKDDDL